MSSDYQVILPDSLDLSRGKITQLASPPTNVSFQRDVASSADNTSTVQFRINPTDYYDVLGSAVMLEFKGRLTITGTKTGAGTNLGDTGEHGICQGALWRICNTLKLQVNNNTITINPGDSFDCTSMFNDLSAPGFQLAGVMPDYGQSTTDARIASDSWPLNPFYSPDTKYTTRYIKANTVGATATDASFDFTIMTPVPLSLFSAGGQTPGLTLLRNLILEMNLDSGAAFKLFKVGASSYLS